MSSSNRRPLDKTVALVTGASSGIGEATAQRLAADGATVVVAARRGDRLAELVAEITAAGGTATSIECDLLEPGQAAALIDATIDAHGRLDTLVNNAGVMLLGPAADAELSDWERMVSLNVTALIECSRAALPHLLAAADDSPRRVADLVNISSTAGRVARSGAAVYNLTKFGVGAFSEALRQEVTARHVRVSLIEPGAVATELTTHLNAAAYASFLERFDGVERLEAVDIADAISYVVTRPRHMAINEILIRPTEQEG